MPLNIVVGAQWGDEGKGRIVDLLAAQADVVARYNGGDNAGHVVTVGSQRFKLHLVPSGLIHTHPRGLIGNGVVVSPAALLDEMDMLHAAGVEVTPQRLTVSYAAHLITPAHKALDAAQEIQRGADKIGTTGRGIGPAYADKTARRGLRVQDLLDPASLPDKLYAHIASANRQLTALYDAEPLEAAPVIEQFRDYAEKLTAYIGDTGFLAAQALARGERVLAEGAQGTLLDLDHGTYPFVTSSNPVAPSALVGLGLGITLVERVIGVTKSFQTRVGSGPFPTEVFEAAAERLRGTGSNPWDEFGTTTGRPRRVGWLDVVLLRYAVRVNGLTELMLTKLDILSGLEPLYLCTAYKTDGKILTDLPMGPANLAPFEPVLAALPGWTEDISGVRNWDDLPAAARNFVARLAQAAGVPVRLASVGPEREQMVVVPK